MQHQAGVQLDPTWAPPWAQAGRRLPRGSMRQKTKEMSHFGKGQGLSTYYICLDPSVKGTWQRGGFSGVFAEIGSAEVPYTTFRAVPIWASYS